MRRLFVFIVVLLGLSFNATAQNDSEQVLIFRNTGEINLLFTTEIDSIVCRNVNIGESSNEEVLSQLFFTKDSTIAIPVAEIDSVAFGSRNAIEPKANVRIMDSNDCEWITGYDGNFIYYKLETPNSILPKVDEKLFYGQNDKTFPLGLAAKVTEVQTNVDNYAVKVKDVELDELFHRLFYAGSITTPQSQSAKSKSPRADFSGDMNYSLNINLNDSIKLSQNNDFSIKGKIVVDALRDYYHLEGTLTNKMDYTFTATSTESRSDELQRTWGTIQLGTYALVFTPSIDVGGFLGVDAELSANFRLQRKVGIDFIFKRKRGVTERMNFGDLVAEDTQTKASADIILKGEAACGFFGRLNLNILRNVELANLVVQVGPYVSGELGFGLLNQLGEYNPELYHKSVVEFGAKAKLSGSYFQRDVENWEDPEEHEVFSNEIKYPIRTYDLFPNYCQSRAVNIPENRTISVSTKTSNKIMREVETGFEIVNKEKEVVDSVFVGTVKPEQEEVQGFSSDFALDEDASATDELMMRPMFHYAGRTIRANTVSLSSDVLLQPTIFYQTNGPLTYISGVPFTGQTKNEETLYIAGPYLPVPVTDTIFSEPEPIIPGIFIGADNFLYGEWSGKEGDNQVTYVFNEDLSGEFRSNETTQKYSFKLNDPQSGRINLLFEDGGNKVLYIESISESTLQYRLSLKSSIITLNKVM